MHDISDVFVRQLAELMPAFMADIHYDGAHAVAFSDGLRGRSHTRVHAAKGETAAFDGVVYYLNAPLHISEIRSALAPNGYAVFVALPGSDAPTLDALGSTLAPDQLVVYRHRALRRATDDSESGYVAFVVHTTYNPLLHARKLLQTGHAGWAFDVLTHIPDELLQDGTTRAHVAAEKQVCLLAWDRAAGIAGRLERFHHSQAVFYDAVSHAPLTHEVYLCQGEFWRRIGDLQMRDRLLRSVSYAAPVPEFAEAVNKPSAGSTTFSEVAPVWTPTDRMPRVLFITHPRPHYGLDVLHDGLCEVLGDENVVEFPYKPTLHGARPVELAHYPCLLNRAGTEYSVEQIIALLNAGEFDVVLYGDLEGNTTSAAAKAIMRAAGEVPVVLVDAQDDVVDHLDRMNDYVGGEFRLYFKREMLSCWQYSPLTVPLPFAYPDFRIPEPQTAERTQQLFWAGHRQFGLRRLYLEHIELHFAMKLDHTYTQDEYTNALRKAAIGLNIFGFGFDTVRYWEIPAHGAMLLAERLPIRVPHNFVDGESAVLFDDLPGLEEKLTYYLAHREEAAAIAARGYNHLKSHHASSARARHLLGWLHDRVWQNNGS